MSAPTTQEFKVIGTRPVRHDGLDKVIGRAKYGADYSFPGMLYGKMLRSPHAHARIKSINVAKALRLPGVKAVVTHADFAPQTMAPVYRMGGEAAINPLYLASNIMAKDKVLYHGHGVAAVAATSPHIAEEALDLIEVEYEVLPPVLDVLEAMKPGAPIVNSAIRQKDQPDKETNIAGEFQFKRGDIDAGFKAADYIVEREFRTEMVHQGYIEPPNALGIYQSDGRATIYTSTQGPFDVRLMSATLLGLPEGNVKVIPAEIGGGFGAKLSVHVEPVALLLAKHDRPSGEDGNDAHRGAARHRSDLGLGPQDQDGGHQGRQNHRGPSLERLRGGRFSRLAGMVGMLHRALALQYR